MARSVFRYAPFLFSIDTLLLILPFYKELYSTNGKDSVMDWPTVILVLGGFGTLAATIVSLWKGRREKQEELSSVQLSNNRKQNGDIIRYQIEMSGRMATVETEQKSLGKAFGDHSIEDKENFKTTWSKIDVVQERQDQLHGRVDQMHESISGNFENLRKFIEESNRKNFNQKVNKSNQ